MARVSIYQGGNVDNQGTTGARVRAADYGENPLAAGLQAIGKVGAQAIEALDQIEDVKARAEANRLAVEHSEHTRLIGQRVKKALGENAEAAAEAGTADLENSTKELLGRASPRARMLLESELRVRSGVAIDGWQTHGFQETSKALESSSVALIQRTVEDAADTDDENAALALLGNIPSINERRARHFGKDQAWLDAENFKATSGFYRSRAVKLAQSFGENGGASAAMQYVLSNRQNLSDEDYDSLTNAYRGTAIKDWAFAKARGFSAPLAGVVEEKPADQIVPEGAVQETPEGKPVVAARADPTVVFQNLIIPNEGRTRVRDNNGAWVQYGINAAFNPELAAQLNRGEISEAQARGQFIEKYWKPSGADQLPPGLAALHIDTYYLNPSKAQTILRQSGGDPERYMELRRDFLGGLHRSNPAKYPDYEGRNKRVEAFAAQLGDGGALPQIDVQVNTSRERIRETVFNTPGVSMELKRAYYEALVDYQQEQVQEREQGETETYRAALSEVIKLGDNFTSVTQLGPLATHLSPTALNTFVGMARNNKEQKPLSLDVQSEIAYNQARDPTIFLDPAYQQSLARRGVTTKQLGQLVQAGGAEQGRVDGAQPKEISFTELEGMAKDVMQAQGVLYWSTENPTSAQAARSREEKLDAQRRIRFMNTVMDHAQRWAVANPGKEPDAKTKQSWVARAALQPQAGGEAVGAMGDNEIVSWIGQGEYNRVAQKLRGGGLPVNRHTVADFVRKKYMNGGGVR